MANLMQEYLLEDYDHSLVNMQDLYEHPLNVKQFKGFRSFVKIIEHALRISCLISYVPVDSKHLTEICLDIASKNGLTTFVKILLRQGVKLNRVNKTYNRAPIHFATEGGHVDTLEALLSESTVNPNLQAGRQTALHIAVNRNDQKCVFLLLQKGASANIPNSEGLTAIYLAAMKKQRNIVELILQEHWQCLDLDNYRDRYNQTTREVIHRKLPGLPLPRELYQYQFYTCYIHDLRYYLNINDEINFLKNMLIDEEAFSSMVEELLKIAMQNDLRKAVMGILHWLKGIEEDSRKFVVEQAARIAIENGRYAILRELLKVVPEIAIDLIWDVCLQLEKLRHQVTDTRLHISDWLECMKLMLDQEGVDIRALTDDKSNTPLHYAVKSGCSDAVTLFLNRDSYIGHMNELKIPPIADIPESILLNYFDNCIQMRTYEQTNAIEFNYRCLMPYRNVSQMHDLGTRELEVFTYIAYNNNLKHLLKHPLLSSFLYLKWHRIRYFLFANFILYMVFYLLLNGYVLSMAYNISPSENRTQLTKVTLENHAIVQNIHQNVILWISIVILLLLFIIREILQLFCCPWLHYVKDFTNCLQIVIIAMTIALLCGAGPQIGITVTLLSTWELMILISQYPRFSTGIVIFRTVFCNFVRFIIPYLVLIVVFALVFHIFFKDSDSNFSKFSFSIFKTITMLTGEFDISFASHHSAWNRTVFVTFVFVMVMVLMNMLNGLAVSDTAEILSKTELITIIYRIHLIAYFENIACAISKPIRHCSSRIPLWWRSFGSLVSSIFLFPHFQRDGKISFKIYDSLNFNDNNGIVKSENNDEYCTILKMDHDIIKKAKQIILNKNQQSDNDKIMIALDKLQKAVGIASDETKVLG